MDVVTAFLNGELQEEIYMQQPPGYDIPGKENLVCKLKKSLYGLKQALRCWNKSFQDSMLNLALKQSTADPCVFIQDETESIMTVAVYVDDLIVMSTSAEKLDSQKGSLGKVQDERYGTSPLLPWCGDSSLFGIGVLNLWYHSSNATLSSQW